MSSINLFHDTFFAMNTRMDVLMWGQKIEAEKVAFLEIQKAVDDLELVLSRFNSHSETFKINEKAGEGFVSVSEKLWNIILDNTDYYHRTKGYFNICYSAQTASLAIEELIQFNKSTCELTFVSPDVKLDFGGIGKGIALERISILLKEHGINNAFISFGGSSVLTRGHHPYGKFWPLSFQNPSKISSICNLTNDAVSTSGLHELGENVIGHIYNPKTKELIFAPRTICIQSDNAVEAEVLSTALIAAPQSEHASILSEFVIKNVEYSIEPISDYA